MRRKNFSRLSKREEHDRSEARSGVARSGTGAASSAPTEKKGLSPREIAPLIVLLVVALAVRLWGITWGLPNPLHDFSYHPDETVMLIHATSLLDPNGVNLFAGRFLPHFYNYGSLQLYLADIVVTVVNADVSANFHVPANTFPYPQFAFAYLSARILTALMGVGTVWALYALGRRCYGRTAGLIGAALLAVTPLHAQHSHFFTVDVPATLWMTLALVWTAKAIKPDTGQETSVLRSFAIAGVFCGLAAATKYNAAIVFLSVIAAAVIGELRGKQAKTASVGAGTATAVAFAAFIVAFLVGCPGSLLESHHFVTDVRFEAAHVSGQGEIWFKGTGLGWIYIMTRNLDAGMGLPLLLASLVSMGYALYKRTPEDALLAATALPYYIIVGAAQSRYARYEIPLLPILALWTGRMIADGLRIQRARVVALALSTVVIGVTAADCLALIRPMTQHDPRDRAALALRAIAPAPAQIGFPVLPWFWTPPVVALFSMPGMGQWLTTTEGQEGQKRFVYNDEKPFDATLLLASPPGVVVMSEYEYFDRLRVGDADTKTYLAVLDRDYQPPLVFASAHPLGGRMTLDGLPVQDLPHDMLYPSPTELVFVKK